MERSIFFISLFASPWFTPLEALAQSCPPIDTAASGAGWMDLPFGSAPGFDSFAPLHTPQNNADLTKLNYSLGVVNPCNGTYELRVTHHFWWRYYPAGTCGTIMKMNYDNANCSFTGLADDSPGASNTTTYTMTPGSGFGGRIKLSDIIGPHPTACYPMDWGYMFGDECNLATTPWGANVSNQCGDSVALATLSGSDYIPYTDFGVLGPNESRTRNINWNVNINGGGEYLGWLTYFYFIARELEAPSATDGPITVYFTGIGYDDGCPQITANPGGTACELDVLGMKQNGGLTPVGQHNNNSINENCYDIVVPTGYQYSDPIEVCIDYEITDPFHLNKESTLEPYYELFHVDPNDPYSTPVQVNRTSQDLNGPGQGTLCATISGCSPNCFSPWFVGLKHDEVLDGGTFKPPMGHTVHVGSTIPIKTSLFLGGEEIIGNAGFVEAMNVLKLSYTCPGIEVVDLSDGSTVSVDDNLGNGQCFRARGNAGWIYQLSVDDFAFEPGRDYEVSILIGDIALRSLNQTFTTR